MQFAWLLIVIIMAAGCGQGVAQAKSPDMCDGLKPAEKGEWSYCGSIDDTFLAALKREEGRGIRRVLLTSGGGFTESAIAASKYMNERGIELRVRKACMSACAQFLFVTARTASIEPGTVLAMHWTNTLVRLMRLRRDLPEFERLDAATEKVARLEEEFYRSRGLDVALLIAPAEAMQTRCVAKDVDWDAKPTPIVNFLARHLWWIPSPQTLEKFGMPPRQGTWVLTPKEIDVVARREGVPSAALASDYTMKRKISLKTLPLCPSKK